MGRYFFVTIVLVVSLFAIDFYVYRNWRRFARRHRQRLLRWSVHVYTAFLVVMPFTLPFYFSFFRWWEVEPKLPRAIFFGVWTVYYLPKLLLFLVLALRDAARFILFLFHWFRQRLNQPVQTEPAPSDLPLDLSDMKTMPRREFLNRLGWSAAAVPFVVVGYGVFRSLYDFEVHRVPVYIRDLPRALHGLTIAQVSDLHAGSFFSERPAIEAAELINGLKPDVIAITGDFVNHDAGETALIRPALERLKADVGVFGCLGNHDHYADVGQVAGQIRASAVDLLVNQHRTVQIDGARLHIIGTDNTGFNQHHADLPGAVQGIQQSEPGDEARILLAHDPTFWDNHVRPGYADIDLMLCGHTHGGQIGFELGPLRWSLARMRYERWAGLYVEPRADGTGAQYLYVNRGLSTVGPPIRIGIRPEITLLTLLRA